MGEWHHEAYKETNKSFPAEFTRDCFKRSRSSDNSEDVSKIKFKAWGKEEKLQSSKIEQQVEKKLKFFAFFTIFPIMNCQCNICI
jgi:hypothetical protein